MEISGQEDFLDSFPTDKNSGLVTVLFFFCHDVTV